VGIPNPSLGERTACSRLFCMKWLVCCRFLLLVAAKKKLATVCTGNDACSFERRVLFQKRSVFPSAEIEEQQHGLVTKSKTQPVILATRSLARKEKAENHGGGWQQQSQGANCEKFIKDGDRNFHDFLGGHAFGVAETGAIEGLSKALAKSAMKVAASSAVGIIFPIAAEFFISDPDEERIQNLQKATACIYQKTLQLEAKVEDLAKKLQEQTKTNQKKFGEASKFIGELQKRPLENLISRLKTAEDANVECTSMMRCAADVKFLNKKFPSKYKLAAGLKMCDDFFQDKIHNRLEDCDAKAFHDKAKTKYTFLMDEVHKKYYETVNERLRTKNLDYFPAARSFVTQFTAAIMSVILAWSSMAEWAQAICHPYGAWNPCSQEEWRDVEDGFGSFVAQIDSFKTFIDNFDNHLRTSSSLRRKLRETGVSDLSEVHTLAVENNKSGDVAPIGKKCYLTYYPKKMNTVKYRSSEKPSRKNCWNRKGYSFRTILEGSHCGEAEYLSKECSGTACFVSTNCSGVPCTMKVTMEGDNNMKARHIPCVKPDKWKPDTQTTVFKFWGSDEAKCNRFCGWDTVFYFNKNLKATWTRFFEPLEGTVEPFQNMNKLLHYMKKINFARKSDKEPTNLKGLSRTFRDAKEAQKKKKR